MQGIYVDGRRPKSKKDVKAAVAEKPGSVALEATSMFGNEYGGAIDRAPDGEYYFVGPNPHTDRRFYGQLVKRGDTFKVK